MRKPSVLLLLLSIVSLAAAIPAHAQGGTAVARLRGFEEVPASLATPGGGTFTATINEEGTEIDWQLRYSNPEGSVTQAHLHFGQKGTNGAFVVFLCSNLGNGPAGTQACPERTGTVSGTITAADVLAAPAQSFAAGDLFSLIRAIRFAAVYANVHTTAFPGGEIRGQLVFMPSQ